MATIKEVQEALGTTVSSIGKNKAGQIIVRQGYFYRNGNTSTSFSDKISDILTKHGISFNIVDSGDVWKVFKGDASIANQSHFFAIIE